MSGAGRPKQGFSRELGLRGSEGASAMCLCPSGTTTFSAHARERGQDRPYPVLLHVHELKTPLSPDAGLPSYGSAPSLPLPPHAAPLPPLPPSPPPLLQPPSVAMVVQSASMERSKAVFHRPISLTDDDKTRSVVGGGGAGGEGGREV